MPPSELQHYGPHYRGPDDSEVQPYFQYSQCTGKRKALCVRTQLLFRVDREPTYMNTNTLLVPKQNIQKAIAANPLKTALPAQPGDTLIDVNNDSTRRNKLVLIL